MNHFLSRLTKLICSFLISALLFAVTDVDGDIYLGFFCLIWAGVLLNYGTGKNRDLLADMLAFSMGNFLAYSWLYYLHFGLPEIISHAKLVLLIIAVIEVLLAECFVVYGKMRYRKKKAELPEQFASRRYDMERLAEYISRVDVVGLNGQWGDGKSMLINRFCELPEIREQYKVVRIDLLSFNLDKLEEILLLELEKVLAEDRIFSKYSGKLRKIMGSEGFLSQVKTLFLTDDGSTASVFRDLKEAALKLDRKVLIVLEDIDRISDDGTISKLFDISEKLAGGNIKILFQFSTWVLQEKGFDRAFLEKYIPFIVNLTEVSFKECVGMFCKELEMSQVGVTEKDLRCLSGVLFDDYQLKKALEIKGEFRIRMHGMAVRKVRTLLEDLKVLLQQNEVYREEHNKRIVIVYLFMRNVLYECYEMLNLVDRPINSLVLRYKEEEYTMAQLIYLRKLNAQDKTQGISEENLREIFTDSNNRNVYCVLALLGYHFEVLDAETGEDRRPGADAEDATERLRLIGMEAVQDIQKKNSNEKIDRILWSLHANGKSEYTDMEHIVSKLSRDVLAKPAEKQEEAWLKFGGDLYHERNLWKDNRSIFLMGVDAFLPVFQAFRVSEASTGQWIDLLSFYFRRKECKEIGVRMIEALNYCDLRKRAVFLYVVRRFNECKIVGNLNHQPCYHRFLQEFLAATEYFAYNDRYESWMLDFKPDLGDYEKEVKKILLSSVDNMKRRQEKCLLPLVKEELQDVIRFVEHNIKLIDCKTSVKVPGWSLKSEMSGKVHHDYPQVYEALEAKRQTVENVQAFLEEVQQAYGEEKLNLHEVDALLKDLHCN